MMLHQRPHLPGVAVNYFKFKSSTEVNCGDVLPIFPLKFSSCLDVIKKAAAKV